MQFVELHQQQDNMRIAIDPALIKTVRDMGGFASLQLWDSAYDLLVKESYDDIIKLVGKITRFMGTATIAHGIEGN